MLFSAQFVDTISKALEIPKWRLFKIRTQKGNVDECLKVKFSIIGKGIYPPPPPSSSTYFVVILN